MIQAVQDTHLCIRTYIHTIYVHTKNTHKMHTCMVLLRGNVALAREYLLSKRHRLIEFRVLIRSQDTQSCKLPSTQSKLRHMILHVRTHCT